MQPAVAVAPAAKLLVRWPGTASCAADWHCAATLPQTLPLAHEAVIYRLGATLPFQRLPPRPAGHTGPARHAGTRACLLHCRLLGSRLPAAGPQVQPSRLGRAWPAGGALPARSSPSRLFSCPLRLGRPACWPWTMPPRLPPPSPACPAASAAAAAGSVSLWAWLRQGGTLSLLLGCAITAAVRRCGGWGLTGGHFLAMHSTLALGDAPHSCAGRRGPLGCRRQKRKLVAQAIAASPLACWQQPPPRATCRHGRACAGA